MEQTMMNSLLNLEELTEATKGKVVLGNTTKDFIFTNVQTDSRLVEKNTLFVPLIGEFQDGHKYIPQAIEKGASVILIDENCYSKDKNFFDEIYSKNPDVFMIAVKNTLHGLQDAAECYVKHFPNLIKVAVTGSSGKTTSKEILASILRQKYNVITNKGNFNSETGLPLSVFNIREEHELGLFEMGMNRVDEIKEIANVLKPKYAVVTNIGTAHIGILGSRENIAKEKSNVFNHFDGTGVGVIPCDDDFASFMKEKVNGKVIFYGENCDENVKNIQDLGLDGTSFELEGNKINLKLPGKYNLKNALGAIALAKELGLTASQIACGINNMEAMFGRSEVLHGQYTVVQDCYNANPDSMEKSVEFVSSVTSDVKKCFVLGDMLELGEESKAEHEKLGLMCANSSADVLIFVGFEIKAAYEKVVSEGFAEKAFFFEGKDENTISEASACILENVPKNSIVLIKASRGIGLEKITKNILSGTANE